MQQTRRFEPSSDHVPCLTDDQVQQFIDEDFIKISGCFDAEFAAPLIRQAYDRLGNGPNDSSAWEREICYLDHLNRYAIRGVSPNCWGAICDLLGGEGRIRAGESSDRSGDR